MGLGGAGRREVAAVAEATGVAGMTEAEPGQGEFDGKNASGFILAIYARQLQLI